MKAKRTLFEIFEDFYYKKITIEEFLNFTKDFRRHISTTEFYSKVALYKMLLDMEIGK